MFQMKEQDKPLEEERSEVEISTIASVTLIQNQPRYHRKRKLQATITDEHR